VKLPLWIKALVLGGVLLLAWASLQAYDERRREEGRVEIRAQVRQAAEAQTERNRELQQAAEKRYTVEAEPRERFITQTITEVRDATENLAACRLDAAAVRLLNDAGACARGDPTAACGAGEPLLGAP
jgi:hypothetical protein